MKKLRILLLAQQNNPDWISVPLVGYQHSAALSELHDVTLVTHVNNKSAILRQGKPWRVVHAIDLGWWEKFYDWCFIHVFKEDFGSQILTVFRIPFYWAFEWLAWRHFKNDLKSGAFDLVLRLTPVAPVAPSLFAGRCKAIKVPFVIGPINGGLPWPKNYSQAERQKEWISHLRFFYRYLPFAKSTYRDATAVVAGSTETFEEYLPIRDKLFFMPENGIREETVIQREPRGGSKPLQLLFVGRLIPSKACDLALKAAAGLLQKGLARFTVIGDGPERKALEDLAKELGVTVAFTGMISHPQTMEHFRTADVLVFPSIREFGGGVVFEALAQGCVPVVTNYGGPGDIVVNGVSGYSVNLKDEDYTILELTKILEKLSAEPLLLEKMSREGQRYAREELSWKGKALKMTAIFQWCLEQGQKPELLPPRLKTLSQ